MSANFNQILLIDSLPDGENTAARLFADVHDWAQVLHQTPGISTRRVLSGADFLALLNSCADRAQTEPFVPLLHIECHGREEGLKFADGSRLTWVEIKPSFVVLNMAMKLNLIVVVAACFGGSIAGSVRAEERAPFWAFLAPKREIGAGNLWVLGDLVPLDRAQLVGVARVIATAQASVCSAISSALSTSIPR